MTGERKSCVNLLVVTILNAARTTTDDRNLSPSIPIDAIRLTDETNSSAVPELSDETTRSRIRTP